MPCGSPLSYEDREEITMPETVYTSTVRINHLRVPYNQAMLPAESEPVLMSSTISRPPKRIGKRLTGPTVSMRTSARYIVP